MNRRLGCPSARLKHLESLQWRHPIPRWSHREPEQVCTASGSMYQLFLVVVVLYTNLFKFYTHRPQAVPTFVCPSSRRFYIGLLDSLLWYCPLALNETVRDDVTGGIHPWYTLHTKQAPICYWHTLAFAHWLTFTSSLMIKNKKTFSKILKNVPVFANKYLAKIHFSVIFHFFWPKRDIFWYFTKRVLLHGGPTSVRATTSAI